MTPTSLSPTQSDQAILLQIEKLVHGGKGLAHDGSLAVFVPGVLPGETVRVLIDRPRKGYAEGTLLEVLSPSPERQSAPCPVYGQCGGCHLQHAAPAAQLELKRQILAETLTRLGGLHDISVPPLVPSPTMLGYRSRARLAVGRSAAGNQVLAYHAAGSHRCVPIAECPLLAPPLNEALAGINRLLSELKPERMGLQEVRLGASLSTGDVVIRYEADRATRAQAYEWFARVRQVSPKIKGQVLHSDDRRRRARWIDGEPVLTESMDGMIFRISDGAFAQANWHLNQFLVKTVKAWALDSPQEQESYQEAWEQPTANLRVLELYAGIGNLSLPLAREGAWVTLVEGNRTASADARANARMKNINGCRFRTESIEAFLAASCPGEYDLAVLNPPRVGLSKDALNDLVRLKLKRVLYLSCDPPTLARDLSVLRDSGYRITRLQGYDMFPQTMHVETLVELVAEPSSFRH